MVSADGVAAQHAATAAVNFAGLGGLHRATVKTFNATEKPGGCLYNHVTAAVVFNQNRAGAIRRMKDPQMSTMKMRPTLPCFLGSHSLQRGSPLLHPLISAVAPF